MTCHKSVSKIFAPKPVWRDGFLVYDRISSANLWSYFRAMQKLLMSFSYLLRSLMFEPKNWVIEWLRKSQHPNTTAWRMILSWGELWYVDQVPKYLEFSNYATNVKKPRMLCHEGLGPGNQNVIGVLYLHIYPKRLCRVPPDRPATSPTQSVIPIRN